MTDLDLDQIEQHFRQYSDFPTCDEGLALVAEVRRLRAELDRFKPQPMSQQCRDGRHGKTGDWRCHNCRCLCHTFEHSRAGHDPACESLQREYDRTVGDLAVAVAEAARVREALQAIREWAEGDYGGAKRPIDVWPGLRRALDAALDGAE